MKRFALVVACLLLFATPLMAAPLDTVKIWPDGAPGETGDVGEEKAVKSGGVTRVSNVTQPTITVYPAPPDKANGCAVVICPGGGYHILAIDLEGYEVAEWLNSLGVTAFVLKYRVPRRKGVAAHEAPLMDVQRTFGIVRSRAKEWNIDPNRVGVLGFSAGGHLTMMAATQWRERAYEPIDEADKLSCRPDFAIPIYAAYLGDDATENKLSPLVTIDKETPPMFLAVTQDDKNRGVEAARVFIALSEAGVEAELHVYSKGGHGYGLRPTEKPVSSWNERCGQWMKISGLLKKKSE